MAKDKWARITANLEPPLSELAKARAKSLHQSVAGYVTTLIERDIAAAGAVGEGKQAAYGISEVEKAVPAGPDGNKSNAPATGQPSPRAGRGASKKGRGGKR